MSSLKLKFILVQTPTNENEDEPEDIVGDIEYDIKEQDILAQAIEGNKKRMNKIKESDAFFENHASNKEEDNDIQNYETHLVDAEEIKEVRII